MRKLRPTLETLRSYAERLEAGESRETIAIQIRVSSKTLRRWLSEAGLRCAIRRPDGPLTRRERQIVDLADLGMTQAEIAAALRISVENVRVQLCRARKKL